MPTFGEKLKELRGKAGLTQEAFAQKVGLGISAVRDWEQDRKLPSMPSLYKLAEVLGVSCEAFKDCTSNEPEPAKKGKGKK